MCCQTFSYSRRLNPRISTLDCTRPVGQGCTLVTVLTINITDHFLSSASLLSLLEAWLAVAGSRLARSCSTLSSSRSSRGERWPVAGAVMSASEPGERGWQPFVTCHQGFSWLWQTSLGLLPRIWLCVIDYIKNTITHCWICYLLFTFWCESGSVQLTFFS